MFTVDLDAFYGGHVFEAGFHQFAGCYGTSTENPRYVPRAGFYEDEPIDFTILAGNYGEIAV